MIGYYVHHQGRGHLHRAAAVIAELDEPVTVLSSLHRPADWTGEWIVLDRDDGGVDPAVADVTAGGRLHWAPRRHDGLQRRTAAIAGWIAAAHPTAFVVDLSVEVTVQARLCGVPVVGVVLPGRRDDSAHQLGFALCDAIIAPWAALAPGMATGLAAHRDRVHHVGGISRFDGRAPAAPGGSGAAASGVQRRVLLLGGTGGARPPGAAAGSTGWHWTERSAAHWTDDPWPDLCAADVVVTHCGLGAVADTAASRRPAVLLPAERPHGEQAATATGLARAGVGVVLTAPPRPDQWPALLDQALQADPANWGRWSSGDGAARAARVIARVAARP